MKRLFCLCVSLCFLATACQVYNTTYQPQIHQPLENITQIELLDSSIDDCLVVLYSLSDEEIDPFLEEFIAIPFRANGHPPVTSYGYLSVRLWYKDGHNDVIGIDANWYYSPEGEAVGKYYWYHAENRSDFYDLFSKYVDADLVPGLD